MRKIGTKSKTFAFLGPQLFAFFFTRPYVTHLPYLHAAGSLFIIDLYTLPPQPHIAEIIGLAIILKLSQTRVLF